MTNEADALANLPAALDLAAFEQSPSGLFQILGALPGWLNHDEFSVSGINLAERFPLLELFFADCASVFETGTPSRS